MPKPAKTTATKRNAYRIRTEVSAAIFKEFRERQCCGVMRGTIFANFNMPLLSSIANLATRAVMQDPKLDIVLKKL